MTEITWGIVLQSIIAPLIVAFLYYRAKELLISAKKGWEKYEALKEENIKEWRETYTKNQCEIKNTLKAMNENMHDKVTWEHCDDKMEKLDERIRIIGK